MKKIALLFTLALGTMSFAKAGNYKLDEQKLNDAFSNSTEVSFEQMYASDLDLLNTGIVAKGGEKTRGGYLLRSFFCGSFAIHRYYMGTEKGGMWALYFCVPVVGGIVGCVDFWGAVFVSDFYTKYENNDKYIVWLN